jgi:hypothetical protein
MERPAKSTKLRTYSRKKSRDTDDDGIAPAPLSPPQKKASVWKGFAVSKPKERGKRYPKCVRGACIGV